MPIDLSSTGESSNKKSHFCSQTAEGIHLFGPTLSQWISVSRASIAGHDFQQGDQTCTDGSEAETQMQQLFRVSFLDSTVNPCHSIFSHCVH